MLIRLMGLLGIWELVWLRDCFGQVYLTRIRKSPWDVKTAPVFCWTNVGNTILHPDGTCSGESSYIKEWKPYKQISPVERVKKETP